MCLDIGRRLCQRTLTVQPVQPEDLPVIKMLVENAKCRDASLAFVRDEDEALHGCVPHGL